MHEMKISEEDPPLSVLIVVRNGRDFVGEAVQSLLAQTFVNFELLIVNDGSEDDTGDIIDGFAAVDPRVQVFHRPYEGVTAALVFGMSICRGNYIARMDADDVSHPDRLRKQYEYMKNNPDVVALGTEVEMIEEGGRSLGVYGHAITHEEIYQKLLTGDGAALSQPTVMFTKKAYLAVGGYNLEFKTTQDLDLFLRFAEYGKIANLPDVLLQWRQHSRSINRTKTNLWVKYRRMAVRRVIERIGADGYVNAYFPDGPTPHLPRTTMEYAGMAMRNNRLHTAAALYTRAIFNNENISGGIKGILRVLIKRFLSFLNIIM